MKKLLLILGIMLWASQVWGATYYVKNGGNDSLDGRSDANAWATIAKVQATVTSGDTVYFRSQDTWVSSGGPKILTATAGVTYDGSTYGSGTKATLQASADTPSWNNHAIILVYADNVTIKGFDIDMNDKKTGGIYIGGYATNNVSNTTIHDCVIHDNTGVSGDWRYGILVGNTSTAVGYTVSNTIITNCHFYGIWHEGIAIYAGWANANNRNDKVLVRGNDIDKGGLLIANDSDNVIAEYNAIIDSGTQGIYIRVSPAYEGAVSSAPENWIIRYNIIAYHDCYGILVVNPQSHSMTGSIYNNIFYQNGKTNATNSGADLFIRADPTWTYPDSVFNIYNNTFYNTENPASNVNLRYVIALGGWSGDLTGLTVNFKNNIVYAGAFVPFLSNKVYTLNHSDNLIYRSSGASDTHVVTRSTNYNRAGVLTWEPTAKNTNPVFKGGTFPTGFTGTYGRNMVPNTNYFAITSGAALNNGATLGSPYNGCINGAGLATPIYRPAGAYDIGAYEYVESAPGSSSLQAPTGLRFGTQ